MVEDIMEISSDHGHNDEQGDIDLDIDLTGDPGDEDFILEDVTSHVDFGDDFHLQPSAAVNDDVMLDDDNESYQMEDAEILEEETEHIIEQESMSFATDGETSYYGVDGQIRDQSLADETNGLGHEGQGYDPTNDEQLGFDLQQDPKVAFTENDLEAPDDSHTQHGAEGDVQNTAGQGSRTSSPGHENASLTAPTEPRSPPASILEPGPSPAHSAQDNTDTTHLQDADDKTVDLSLIEDASSLQHVVVVYREVEYALFSASEHDDPDLFFLSDKTIAERPLSEFFKAIREVIHNDLTEEDELCLVVDSLGLQAEEVSLRNSNDLNVKLTTLKKVSSFIEDVTLLQVLSLHAKLVENDGLEDPGSCHITLKTRNSFSRRFSNLMAGVAEGKGLSHYAYWDDQSIDLDDSEDPGESKYDFYSNGQVQELAEATENYHEELQHESAQVNATRQDLVAEADEEVDVQKSEEDSGTAFHLGLPEATSTGSEPAVMTPNMTPSKPIEKQQERESDVDEDGDLIDYSEDEDVNIEGKQKAAVRNTDNDETAAGIYTDFFYSTCFLPQTCFCSKCQRLIVEEFEQRDELLRRRSLDRRQPSAAATPEELDEEAEETGVGHQPADRKAETEKDALEYQQSNDEGETTLLAEGGVDGNDGDSRTSEKEDSTDLNEIDFEQDEVREGEDVDNNEYGHFTESHLDYGHEQTDRDPLALSDIPKVDTGNDEKNAPLEQYGEVGYYDDAELNHDYAAEQGANRESAISEFENNGLELELEESLLQNDSEQDNHLLGPDEANGHIIAQDASKASSLDAVETAESSVTLGADEIQYGDDLLGETIVAESEKSAILVASPGFPNIAEQKDEIDYEDDEEEAELQSPAATFKAQGYQNANGKRSIADVESNDLQIQANGMLRPPNKRRRVC